MDTSAIWQGSTARRHPIETVAGHRMAAPRGLVVQRLGLAERDAAAAESALHRVGERLGLRFQVRHDAGDIVLLGGSLARRMSKELIDAVRQDRPLVVLDTTVASSDAMEMSLWQQIEPLALVRQQLDRPADLRGSRWMDPHTGADSVFDTGLDAPQSTDAASVSDGAPLLLKLMHGARAPFSPVLSVSYRPGMHLRVDFQRRQVVLDPEALVQLRLQQALPQVNDGARPGPQAVVRDLDATLWDLGIAAGRLPLIGAPDDGWHALLRGTGAEQVVRYTRVPHELDIARRLLGGPATPAALRRLSRVSPLQLRSVVQACLLLDLVEWVRVPSNLGAM
ncbi:hypothetical protein [Ideonella sp. A 288]|uniref:hypothetical protein n=1 Tax=Ideonella sp. A 288 TaxID=1962181 RepID=UPI000B4B4C2D|nr:hypothetical protein [Ideonella sp. A 288]